MGTIGTSIDTTVSKLEDQLKLWGAKLNELVAKAEVAGQETKIDARKHLDDVKDKLADARAKLDEAKAAGGDKWEKFKSGVELSWKKLEGAFHKLTQEAIMTDAYKNVSASSNTTDATIGQSLRTRVEARKAEIEASINSSTLDARTRLDLEIALAEVEGLLTGDLDRIPRVVAAELNTWLEANKHLDEHHEAAPRDGASVPTTETFSASG